LSKANIVGEFKPFDPSFFQEDGRNFLTFVLYGAAVCGKTIYALEKQF